MDQQIVVTLTGLDKWVLGVAGTFVGGCVTSMVVMVHKMYANCLPTIQDNTSKTNVILLRMEGYFKAKAEDGRI